ncbi:glycosyltransferase [Zunongwangia sp. SCSIO 43204]|uniref:glycosyltransferase n=1 Tax=Zunongwangia sp. SCSIO 43204 TaxID=2779359 RepID=UPI001CA95AC1|nr:glycosyltransferase [Zunongwangia sp. SCSIO 43204]UAB84822.1 glycosyltransferase [Zunongwangia sp. SCSIO 43204]
MKNNNLAPICLFTYNRLNQTIKTIEALSDNYLASRSDLIIFSDGAKDNKTQKEVDDVRNFLKTVNGFNSIKIFESNENRGLGPSIISGVSQVVGDHGKVIVLEDDLYTTPNFLDYMNQALDFYADNDKIISVCGYGLKIKKPKNYIDSDFYLYGRSSSWGWGTWKNRWESIDWDVKDWQNLKSNKTKIKAFNYNGSDMFAMLKSVKEGKGNSWAIRFCYTQFKQRKYSLMPFKSFVENIGFGNEGTNTKYKFSRFKTEMNPGKARKFNFDKNIKVNKNIERECYKYHSLIIRVYSRIRYVLG